MRYDYNCAPGAGAQYLSGVEGMTGLGAAVRQRGEPSARSRSKILRSG